jgi:hypothetical protein
MRHIPEDELHAYLDQGLSRTQCVEIESHLAECPSCRAMRDGIAALRDRTTALLARLAPPRAVPPAFEVIRSRAAEVASQRRRRMHLVAWAASLVAAVGLGWTTGSLVRSHASPETSAPAVASVPVPVAPAEPRPDARRPVAVTADRTPGSKRAAGLRPAHPAGRTPTAEVVTHSLDSTHDATRAAALSVLNPTPALELTRLERPSGHGDLEFGGMWRTMSWDGAKAEAGERLPHIDGLPVVQVQVQSGERSSRPVTVVAQQLSSGQVIRTIEGPATDVSELLSRRAISEVDSLFLPGDSTGLGRETDHAMAMQLGDRMLAITGDLPSDSLRAMIRRLNAEMRSK